MIGQTEVWTSVDTHTHTHTHTNTDTDRHTMIEQTEVWRRNSRKSET